MKQILVHNQVHVNMNIKHFNMISEQVTSCAQPLKHHFQYICISLSLPLTLHNVLYLFC